MTLENSASKLKSRVSCEGPFVVDLLSKTYIHVEDIRKVTVKKNYIKIQVSNHLENYSAEIHTSNEEEFFRAYHTARMNLNSCTRFTMSGPPDERPSR